MSRRKHPWGAESPGRRLHPPLSSITEKSCVLKGRHGQSQENKPQTRHWPKDQAGSGSHCVQPRGQRMRPGRRSGKSRGLGAQRADWLGRKPGERPPCRLFCGWFEWLVNEAQWGVLFDFLGGCGVGRRTLCPFQEQLRPERRLFNKRSSRERANK